MTTGLPVAVVTGGNRGIGLEVCRQLAERGYEVVLGSRDLARGERAAAGLGSRHVHALALDVDSTESVNAAASRVGHDFGRCDVLINNAAIHWPCRQDGSCPRAGRLYSLVRGRIAQRPWSSTAMLQAPTPL